jgi:predicted GNAT family N-acyltransferase
MSNLIFKVASSPEEIQRVQKMRFEVFTQEQGIPHELDIDGDDERSIHVLAVDEEDNAMASGRLTINGNEGVLSRIAVHQQFRGAKLGQQTVRQLEKIAYVKGVHSLSLTPHAYLEKFYSDLGYHTSPGEKHVGKYTLLTMTKSLQ